MFKIDEEKTCWFGICLLISGEDIESVIGQYRLFFFFFLLGVQGNPGTGKHLCLSINILYESPVLRLMTTAGFDSPNTPSLQPCSVSWHYTTGLLLTAVFLWHHGAKYGKISFFIG